MTATLTAAAFPRIRFLDRLAVDGRLGGLACALLVALAFALVHPALEIGANDDWSYARTSLDLARTGHFVYNGWATAMLGWQVVWGALFIKLFGYSYLTLRLSTLIFAMGTAYLYHHLCLRFGLHPLNAILASCTLVISPVFLPLSASFMTDVPGVFWLLVCLWACLNALAARNPQRAIGWLAAATLSAIVGGTGRQIVWLGALVMMPATAWLLRRSKVVLFSSGLFWLGTCAAILACLAWFNRQPFAIPEHLPVPKLSAALLLHTLQQYRDIFLTTLLLALPVLAPFALYLRKVPRVMALTTCLAVLAVSLGRLHSHGAQSLAPWMPNFFTEYGVGGAGSWENLGTKPTVLSPFLRLLLTLLLIASTSGLIASLLRRPLRLSDTKPKAALDRAPSWHDTAVLLIPFSLAYLALLFPRAAFDVALDRYLLPLVAVALIPLLRFHQERFRPNFRGFSFALLTIFSAYSVAATHDYFATGRARLAAASEISVTGVPRTAIQGGWEYDGVTQLDRQGYINDWRLTHPVGAYRYSDPSLALPENCRFWFSKYTPVVQPRYFVVFSRQSCLADSPFFPVTYTAWLPPARRQILIQQAPGQPGAAR